MHLSADHSLEMTEGLGFELSRQPLCISTPVTEEELNQNLLGLFRARSCVLGPAPGIGPSGEECYGSELHGRQLQKLFCHFIRCNAANVAPSHQRAV
jgi:hypothetical protein